MTRREFMEVAAVAAAQAAVPQALAESIAGLAPPGDPTALSLAEASAAIRSGKFTSTELTGACLARIAVYDPKLNLFVTVMRHQALAQAARMDAETKSGRWRGPLHGIPIALKDLIDTAGTLTTGGSGVFEDRIPEADATVTARLSDAGAVIVGKTNLYEFGMGGCYFGPTLNPWALDRYTGGTSSGSGAAVAACVCYGALGTDTRGSVRNPASFCSVVGLKATHGLVPIRGIIPAIPSLDCCGPLTRTVEDTAILLNALAGYDRLDPNSVEHPREDYVAALRQPLSDVRLGIPANEGFFDNLDPEVEAAVREAIRLLATLARGTREALLPPLRDRGWSPELDAEMWACHQETFTRDADRYCAVDRPRLQRLEASHGGDAGEYVRSRWALERLRRTIDDSFAECDLMVLPSQRTLPPLLSEIMAHKTHPGGPPDPTSKSENPSNSAPFNWYGIPALSIPCGFSRSGLPIGLMIVGPRFSEGRVLALARAYERATDWHRRRPPLSPDMAAPGRGSAGAA